MEDTASRCRFFLKKKNRYCKMIPGKGKKYCGEHSYLSEENEGPSGRKRIPCPLDGNHTVFEDQLEKHLKKCNVTKKRQVDYYVANINRGLINEMTCEEKLPLRNVPKKEVQACIDKLKAYFSENPSEIETSILVENEIQDEINKMNSNLSLIKHLQQQSSLIGNLRKSELLTSGTVFVEFGAGRGMLSHWIQKAVKDQPNMDFLLVDRASTRYKADSYHRGPNQGPSFNRIQIDIEHLNLSKVPLLLSSQRGITGVSKHLCGAATDLALRCLLNTAPRINEESSREEKSSKDSRNHKKMKLDRTRIQGLLFALCCHHRCSWASWATSGSRSTHSAKDREQLKRSLQNPVTQTIHPRHESEVNDDKSHEIIKHFPEITEATEEHGEVLDEGSCIKALGLSKSDSEEIGRQSKQLLDAGRVWYLRKYGLDVSLVYYVDRSVSLENVALLASNTSSKVIGDQGTKLL